MTILRNSNKIAILKVGELFLLAHFWNISMAEEEGLHVETNLGYIVSSNPAWTR